MPVPSIPESAAGAPAGRPLSRRLRQTGGEVPYDVGLADALLLCQLGDPVPRQRGVRQVVPAGEVQRFERGREQLPRLLLLLDHSPERIALGIGELHAPHRQDLRCSEKSLPPERSPLGGRIAYSSRGGRPSRPCGSWPRGVDAASSTGRGPRARGPLSARESWSRMRTASILFSRTDSTRSEYPFTRTMSPRLG